MAIRTLGDIQDEFIVRANIATTASGFLTDTILNDWTRFAILSSGASHKFPFTEGRVSTTFVGGTEEYPFEGYKSDSFRLVQIGGKRLRKLDFRNYQIFREEESSADERVFSDFARALFVNPNVDLSGTLTAWGQYTPIVDPTDKTGTTVFSDNDEEGNEAVVLEMMSYLKDREKKPQEAEVYHKRAQLILDGIWDRVMGEAYQYQTHPDSGGMFRRFDVLRGSYQEEIFRRDQF